MSLQPTAGWIVRRTIMSVLFWIFAFSLLLYMAGLRVNWQAKTVRATSSIFIELSGRVKEPIEYILNGQASAGTAPVTISQLTPGAYTLIVRQPDHQEWHRSFRLEPGEAANFTDIMLVPTIITSREPSEAELKLIEGPLIIADADLRVDGSELYLTDRENKETLLLRLSENIGQALWLPDQVHIIVLAGQSVALVEKTGTNMTPLFTVPQDVINRIFLTKDGATVLVQSGSAVSAYDFFDQSGPFWTHL